MDHLLCFGFDLIDRDIFPATHIRTLSTARQFRNRLWALSPLSGVPELLHGSARKILQ
jgi:hypothetical protein